jgi:hypothetical protein
MARCNFKQLLNLGLCCAGWNLRRQRNKRSSLDLSALGDSGNPDELLKEKWIPRYPGINMPGDYMKDYASDPYNWIHPHQEKLREEAGWTPSMGD